QSRIYPTGIQLVNFFAIFFAQVQCVDIAFGVVEVLICFRVNAAHRADHLGTEQNVVDVDNAEQQIDTGLVVNTGVEVNVLHDVLSQRWALEHVGQTAVTAPVIGNSTTTVRNDNAQIREVLEEIALNQLHESCGISVDVVSTRGMEVVVAAAGY